MSVLVLARVLRSCFLFSTVGIAFISDEALATPCRVYPSEYTYRDDTVTRAESASANCRRYPEIGDLPPGIFSTHFIHCDGTPLKLADTNLGTEQFSSSSSYYQWSAGSDGQLLFIFPTRVSLTNITLHYYSDSDRGRPRLRFYAVRDDFDIWDASTLGTPYAGIASIPPGGVPAGRRSVGINVNFNTMKVLMYKFSSTFQFAVSEVEFFTILCNTPSTTTTFQGTLPIASTNTVTNFVIIDIPQMATTEGLFESTKNESVTLSTPTISSNKQIQNYNAINPREITAWALIVILVVLLIASVVTIVILILAQQEYRRSNKANDQSPDCVLAMDSNPCYEVKQTEAQEAVHVYETVKQHNN